MGQRSKSEPSETGICRKGDIADDAIGILFIRVFRWTVSRCVGHVQRMQVTDHSIEAVFGHIIIGHSFFNGIDTAENELEGTEDGRDDHAEDEKGDQYFEQGETPDLKLET
jgi:hypothetical protein